MAHAASDTAPIHKRPVELLRELIRFDTTNPPGNERECIGYVDGLLRAKASGLTPAGDIVFCALSDEEGFGDYGAKYMVESHPELFEGVRHAIGEFGGFTLHLGRRRFYPIQVAEKQLCTLRLRARG